MSGFGWNFYGFFVFAAAWIVAYFAWARWMEKKETDTERTRSGHGTNTEGGVERRKERHTERPAARRTERHTELDPEGPA